MHSEYTVGIICKVKVFIPLYSKYSVPCAGGKYRRLGLLGVV